MHGGCRQTREGSGILSRGFVSWSGLVFADGLLQALDLDAERKFHKSKDHGVISRAERNRNLQPGG